MEFLVKKPNEVLMTKVTDAGGKAVLYASRPEETDINYRIVCFQNHLVVAVESDFKNSESIKFIGEDYFVFKTSYKQSIYYYKYFTLSPNTPEPVVEGSQTANVVVPSGEEFHTSERGWLKVQFHWDKESKRDETSSCWICVSQAGRGWGTIHISYVGHEVIVDFTETIT